MPDCVDFKLKTPQMTYTNKVWANEDVFEHVKRGGWCDVHVKGMLTVDIRSYIWSQSGDLIGQLLKKTSLFRSKKGLKSLALSSSDMLPRHKSTSLSPSSLRYTVEPPTPMEEEGDAPLSIARALSREPTSPLSRPRSRALSKSPETPSAQILGVPLHGEPSRMSGRRSEDSEEVLRDEVRGDEENGSMGLVEGAKTVKGFLSGKLKKYTSKFDLPAGMGHGSTDDVSGNSAQV
jgi:hypothetical protein